MFNFEITKEDILTHFEIKVLEALENAPYQNSEGEWRGGTSFTPLLNLVIERVAAKIKAELWAEEKNKLQEKIQQTIDNELSKILNTDYQPVDKWGSVIGEKTTIKEQFLKMTNDYWNTQVDKNGKPTSGWGDKMTRAEFVAKGQIAQAFNEEIAKNIEDVIKSFRGSLSETLQAQSKISIEEAIKKLIRS